MATNLSNSIVLRADQILRVRIEDAQAEEWARDSDDWLRRSAQLTITLLEVLKGSLNAKPGATIRLPISQFAPLKPRRPGAPGLWSKALIDPGTELLAFSRGANDASLENLLTEGVCEQLLPSEGCLADVKLILRAESKHLEPPALLALASQKPGQIGYMFTEYLWTRLAEPAMADFTTFELLMQFLELPELALITSWSLLQNIFTEVAYSASLPPEFTNRLVVAMFRMVEGSHEFSVTDNLIQVFLPTLLGLTGGLPAKSASDVFRSLPDERSKTEQVLESYAGNASTTSLLDWLRQD